MQKNKIYLGNSLSILKTFPDESIDCCVTSPPYYNLRNYGNDLEVWDEDVECNHEWGLINPYKGGKPSHGTYSKFMDIAQVTKESENLEWSSGSFCQKCGAWRGELGLEPYPELFIEHLTSIFREVKRVLKSTGTLWVNIGDSYATVSGTYGADTIYKGLHGKKGLDTVNSFKQSSLKNFGYKSKDLIGIPWMLAFSLRNDGWYLRQDIIWAKAVSGDMRVGGAMPESVTDRCSKSHEHIFMLSKSPKYYYDQDAIKEPVKESTKKRYQTGWNGDEKRDYPGSSHNNFSKFMGSEKAQQMDTGNRRDVWFVKTKPFSEAHFACVDKDTEILTNEGWKKYNEVDIGEEILSYNIEEDVIEHDYIQDLYINEDYRGNMIQVNKRDMSMLLTPNHRVLYKKYKNKNNKYKIRRADSLKNGDVIPVSAIYRENRKDDNNTFNYPKLLGFFIADGYVRETKSKGFFCYIEQSCERGKRYLYELHKEEIVSIKHRYRNEKEYVIAEISNSISNEIMSFISDRREPSFLNIFNQNIDWLNQFWEGFILGDGHTRKDDQRESLIKTEHIVDLMQAISVKLGKASKKTIQKKSEVAYNLFLTQKRNISLRGENKGDSKVYHIKKYKGTIWCPQTRNTTWIARRNGRVFFTGNTFPENLIKPIIKAGVPNKVCSKCGNPYIEREEIERCKLECGDKDDNGLTRTTVGLKDLQKYGKKPKKNKDYIPSCSCNDSNEAGIVLDPFFGAGTTGVVAKKEGVNYVGIEKYQKYIDIAEKRIYNTLNKLFNEAEV